MIYRTFADVCRSFAFIGDIGYDAVRKTFGMVTRLKCVLFDFDMTLADSSYAITDSLNMIAESRGLRRVSRQEVLGVIGLPIAESWVALWGAFDESWLEEYRRMFVSKEYDGLRLFPGTKVVLESLRERGIMLGVASNRRNAMPALQATGIADLFDSVVGLQDVAMPKPSPDVLLRSMEFLGVDRAETWYVGDTCDDMRSAVAAGVRGIGVESGNFRKVDLLEVGAWRTIPSVADLPTLPEAGFPTFHVEG